MKVSLHEIEKRKIELKSKEMAKHAVEKEKAKKTIIDQLARGCYEGLLEIVDEFKIDLPKDHLQKAADLYAQSQLSQKLQYAQHAYRQLGNNKKAASLEKAIEAAIRYEIADDFAISMGL
ncbi:MAG: hypothetical protein Q8L34_02390 [Candidatus Woesearchaeota archaeon]|nr:hypothetical protein [Candidatus Woesearchaeota archaeon]